MKIVLDHIMPVPLASIQHSAESIWGNFVELNDREKILLNASSGKGKSTFTLTTIGLRNDYEGKITYNGVDIRSFSPDDWAKIRQERSEEHTSELQSHHDL